MMQNFSSALQLEIKDNQSAFNPRDTLHGTIRWCAEQKRSKKVVELRLGWTVSNEEQTDVMCHSKGKFELSGLPLSTSFSVELPAGPLSYTGTLFSLEWLLEARTSDRSQVATVPFRLSY